LGDQARRGADAPWLSESIRTLFAPGTPAAPTTGPVTALRFARSVIGRPG